MARKVRVFSSLRFKFALALVLFSSLLMLSVMTLLEQNIRRTLIRQNIDKGIGIARGVAFNAEDPLLTGDDIYLFSAVKNAVRSPGIRYALIVENDGRIRAAADISRVGEAFLPEKGGRTVSASSEYPVLRTDYRGEAVLDLAVPVLSVADAPIRLGKIHIGLSEELISREVNGMRNRLTLLTLVALGSGGLLAYLLSGLLVRPVHALVDGVEAIGEGNLEQHLDLKRSDELGLLTDAFNDMASSLREKEYLKNTFERYVSKPLAREILKYRDELKLGGEEKDVTILFSDIRHFTTLAEGLPPARVVEMLNDYFTRMIKVVNHHGGMVDKLMGDSVMALFGAPLPLGDDPLRAVRCAMEMQEAVSHFNWKRGSEVPELQMGIGINTGPVIAGNIGSSQRMEYTVIGDNVNIAARLQGIARAGEVLISEATLAQLGDRLEVTALEPMILKGKKQPVGVYRVDAVKDT